MFFALGEVHCKIFVIFSERRNFSPCQPTYFDCPFIVAEWQQRRIPLSSIFISFTSMYFIYWIYLKVHQNAFMKIARNLIDVEPFNNLNDEALNEYCTLNGYYREYA